jgi:hypothetical protein
LQTITRHERFKKHLFEKHINIFVGLSMNNTEKYIAATKALASFEKSIQVMHEPDSLPYDVARDSLLKRFTLATDTFWKCIEAYLSICEDVDLEMYGPNKLLLACADNSVVGDENYSLFVRMIQARLLVPLAHNEELAQEIADRIPDYFPAMKAVLEKIKPQA